MISDSARIRLIHEYNNGGIRSAYPEYSDKQRREFIQELTKNKLSCSDTCEHCIN
jgi:phage terminase large subunit